MQQFISSSFLGKFIVCVCLLFGAFSTYAVPVVKLDYIGTNEVSGGKPKKDTTPSVNILTRYEWNVKVVKNNGDTARFTTTMPDTIYYNEPFTIHLTTSFSVAPQLLNKIYAFSYAVNGSVIVKLNGETLITTGKFVTGPENKMSKLNKSGYVNFFFKDTLENIEITYVTHPHRNFIALGLTIDQVKEAEQEQEDKNWNKNDSFALGFYYLAFAIIFIILFIFFKEKTENLYFSLFCLCAALSFLWSNFSSGIYDFTAAFLFVLSLEFLSIFFVRILKNREKSKIPLLVIFIISAISFHPAILHNYTHLFGPPIPFIRVAIIVVLGGYAILSSLFFLVQGIGQKQWEARAVVIIVSTALLIFFLTPVIISSIVVSNHLDDVFVAKHIIQYLFDIGLCIYPLSAAIVLGRRNGLNYKKLLAQIHSIKQLSEENLIKEQEKKQMLETEKERLEQEVSSRTAEVVTQKEEIQKQHDQLKTEKRKSDDLLLNILPAEIADELKEKGRSEARFFNDVTVLFTDFVDFTKAAENMAPQELVDELDICFKAFDDIISKHGCEKIKTIGDAYLAVCGLPLPDNAHAGKVADAAYEIIQFMALRKQQGAKTFDIRIGIHSGSVVAGIVGVKKFAYDIWGDTVNTAARMEQNSAPGKINISQTTYELVKDKFDCTYRGQIAAKNKGELSMYFIEKHK